MEYKRFIDLMKEPGNTSPETIPALQELLKEFPYFQSAHLLLACSMKEQQHLRYERQLKLAAAYAPDRKVMYSLLHDRQKTVSSPVAQEIPSPFILHDENESSSLEFVENQAEENTNPFIETGIVSSDMSDKSEDGSEENILELPEEKPYEPRYAIDQEENVSAEIPSQTTSAASTAAAFSGDPREVLKRRLAEILGNPIVEDSSVVTKKDSPEILPVEIPVVESDNSTEKITVVPLKTEPVSDFKETISVPEAAKEIIIPPVAVTRESKEHDPLKELLPEDVTKPLDELEKSEFEYALEASVLTTLESLPVIQATPEKTEPENLSENIISPLSTSESQQAFQNPAEENPRSFTDWLKKLSTGDYGKVEEIHAEEKVSEARIEKSEHLEKTSVPAIGNTLKVEQSTHKSHEKKPETGIVDQKKELIDKFIATEPKIIPSKVEFYSPATQAKRSVEEYDDVVSETLARIYRQQGNNLKARFCYEKLSLFYPEKKTYFAALIKEIDEELNRSNQEDL